MNVKDIISMFKNGVINEILHSSADEHLKDELIQGVKNVETTVIETYLALSKSKQQ